jgi:hypothetical protein
MRAEVWTTRTAAVWAIASTIMTPGHDRRAGEVSLKKGLADADVLDPDGTLVGIHLDDAVDHQERVAMRDHLHDPDDIGLHAHIRGGGGFAHCLWPLSSLFSLTLPP